MSDDIERTFIALIKLAEQVSSGRRFLAKSLSDLKLNFRVLLVIIEMASLHSSLCCDAAQFTNLVGQLGQELQDVVDDSDICHLKDRSLGILVDGD